MKNQLSAKKIQGQICANIPNIIVFDSIDSTNSYGKNYILQENPLPALILAEEQSAGRGRQGRSFFSPNKTGLYMSILYLSDVSAEDSLFATISASVAAALAIEELSGRSTKIKWVNDIYIDGKKAGGILCESVFSDKKMGIVVGIGINVSTKEFPEFDNNTPTCVGELDRNVLAGRIYNYFIKFNSDKDGCLTEYRKRFYLENKEITIHRADGTSKDAIALRVDDMGGLIVESDGKTEIIRSGEVTVRLK